MLEGRLAVDLRKPQGGLSSEPCLASARDHQDGGAASHRATLVKPCCLLVVVLGPVWQRSHEKPWTSDSRGTRDDTRTCRLGQPNLLGGFDDFDAFPVTVTFWSTPAEVSTIWTLFQ